MVGVARVMLRLIGDPRNVDASDETNKQLVLNAQTINRITAK
jgi:hypothetical protein